MKGMKYNLVFKTPQQENILCDDLPIKDLGETLKKLILEKYKIEMNIGRNMLYNLVHRKDKVNKFVRQICDVSIIPRPPQVND